MVQWHITGPLQVKPWPGSKTLVAGVCSCDGEQGKLPELRELVGAGKSTEIRFTMQAVVNSMKRNKARPGSEGRCEGPVLMKDQGWL